MNKMLAGCPVCGGVMHATEIKCEACATTVRSDFESCRFCRLSPEQLEFVALFLSHRGNLSSVGEELHISYPTVSRRLEATLAALDLNGAGRRDARPVAGRDEDMRQILDQLDRGDISAEEATRKLKDL